MLADLCFLIYLTDNNNQLQIASGYDLIREENLEGGSLSKSIIPMLTNALQRGRPLRLPSSSTSADIKGLSDMLGLDSPGHYHERADRDARKGSVGRRASLVTLFQPAVERGRPGLPDQYRRLAGAHHPAWAKDDHP